MSLKVIEKEVRRFLTSSDPEVLCIKGKWGVGKTYAWKKFVKEAQDENRLSFGKPSYVSLFGLKTLDELRYAIFENQADNSTSDTQSNVGRWKEQLNWPWKTFKENRSGAVAMASVFGAKDLADFMYKSTFSLVRQTIVCFDDLERKGDELRLIDVLGLASFLKEERDCKVVLLLNDQELGEEEEDFQKNLEKVADITLTFDLSAMEATQIALSQGGELDELLRPRIVDLGITNIRVIRKIERLAARAMSLLDDFDAIIKEQAIATIVLGSWSIQQPKIAPPIKFIREYTEISYSLPRDGKQSDADNDRWQKAIENYPYRYTDDLDKIILDGVAAGYFNEEELKAKAAANQEQFRHTSRENSFNKAWSDLYHGSLATDDNEFLDALYNGAIENLIYIDPMNLNSAVNVLRKFGRKTCADDLVTQYVKAKNDKSLDFFNIDNHHFSSGNPIDDGLRAAFEERRLTYEDARNPLDVLRSMGERHGWDEADVAVMAKQSEEDLVAVFEALRGENVWAAIETLLRVGKSNDYPESATILERATGALRRIAAKSPMRAEKVRRFGITLEDNT